MQHVARVDGVREGVHILDLRVPAGLCGPFHHVPQLVEYPLRDTSPERDELLPGGLDDAVAGVGTATVAVERS